MKKYYKVVREICGRLESYCENPHIIGWIREHAVVYVPGEWTKPKIPGSKLFCFDSLEAAQTFNKYHGGEIWEVKVQNPSNPPVEIPARNAVDYWKMVNEQRKKKKKLSYPKWPWVLSRTTPEQSVLASRIKLVSRIA